MSHFCLYCNNTYSAAFFSSRLIVCPLKILVGANSPSLCPTIFSVTKTGINFRPLWTANVNPTKSGVTVDRRDHVLITFLLFVSLATCTFFCKFSSTNGPFFNDRGIIYFLTRSEEHTSELQS